MEDRFLEFLFNYFAPFTDRILEMEYIYIPFAFVAGLAFFIAFLKQGGAIRPLGSVLNAFVAAAAPFAFLCIAVAGGICINQTTSIMTTVVLMIGTMFLVALPAFPICAYAQNKRHASRMRTRPIRLSDLEPPLSF